MGLCRDYIGGWLYRGYIRVILGLCWGWGSYRVWFRVWGLGFMGWGLRFLSLGFTV